MLQPVFVDVEVDISRGLNAFTIVGLPDKAVEEAKDRVSAAIKNTGFDSPKSKNHKLTISLAPAELRKEGANFDLAIALAYLTAVDDIRFDPKEKLFLGELSLDGTMRNIKGALSLVIAAKKKGIKEIYIPSSNADEVSMINGIDIYAVDSLRHIVEHLNTKKLNNDTNKAGIEKRSIGPLETKSLLIEQQEILADFKDIKGQEGAKRALEIAASGGHNIMMYGPPGTGKTMLAKAFRYLLPELTFEEMLEVTTIHASSGISQICIHPPFRAPHHTASYVSMVGGGAHPKPGEVTFSHRGVLFMDEFPEFDSSVIESLRQPLEEHVVNISRAKTSVQFPADFILIGSMNLCPCGYLGSKQKACICSEKIMRKYQRKVSGPITDRIDLWVEVSEISYKKLSSEASLESTEYIRKRVRAARLLQKKRGFDFGESGVLNSRIDHKYIIEHCLMSKDASKLLDDSAATLHLSPRMYHRIIRISRTIADLEGEREIREKHILEALQYRPRMG